MDKRLPLATHLIDEPGHFDALETWERHLTEVESLSPSVTRDSAIQSAKKMMSTKRREAKD